MRGPGRTTNCSASGHNSMSYVTGKSWAEKASPATRTARGMLFHAVLMRFLYITVCRCEPRGAIAFRRKCDERVVYSERGECRRRGPVHPAAWLNAYEPKAEIYTLGVVSAPRAYWLGYRGGVRVGFQWRINAVYSVYSWLRQESNGRFE